MIIYNKNSNFNISDIVRISKYQNNFTKGYTSNWSEEVFVFKKVKNTVSWTDVINDLNVKEIIRIFTKKNCNKKIKKSLELKK